MDVGFDIGASSVSFTAASCDAGCTAAHPCAAVLVSSGTSVWVFVGVIAGALSVWGLAVLGYIVWKRRRGEVPVFSLVEADDSDAAATRRTRMPLPLPGLGEGGSAVAAKPGATGAASGVSARPPSTLGAGRHIALSDAGLEMGALLGAPKEAGEVPLTSGDEGNGLTPRGGRGGGAPLGQDAV